jgi:hypothetical protein
MHAAGATVGFARDFGAVPRHLDGARARRAFDCGAHALRTVARRKLRRATYTRTSLDTRRFPRGSEPRRPGEIVEPSSWVRRRPGASLRRVRRRSEATRVYVLRSGPESGGLVRGRPDPLTAGPRRGGARGSTAPDRQTGRPSREAAWRLDARRGPPRPARATTPRRTARSRAWLSAWNGRHESVRRTRLAVVSCGARARPTKLDRGKASDHRPALQPHGEPWASGEKQQIRRSELLPRSEAEPSGEVP